MNLVLKPVNQQVIVVTGATSGIGIATTLAAAVAGAKVALIARNEHTIRSVTTALRVQGRDALHVAADVADQQALQAAAERVVRSYGQIDTWVNSADASNHGQPDRHFSGIVNGSLVALSYLKKQGGALVNVGSDASELATPMRSGLLAWSRAVNGFTEALRVQLEGVNGGPVLISLIQPIEPRILDPTVEPLQVAEAILNAATTCRRDLTQDAMSRFSAPIVRLGEPNWKPFGPCDTRPI